MVYVLKFVLVSNSLSHTVPEIQVLQSQYEVWKFANEDIIGDTSVKGYQSKFVHDMRWWER